MTSAQEASAINRRKEIYETLHPEAQHGGHQGPSGTFCHMATESFSEATAKATGRSERMIRAAATRGEALGDDLDELRAI